MTDDRLQPTMAAGHSLGEYSALVAAKALSFESALTLVQKRGELMGVYGEGEMTALSPWISIPFDLLPSVFTARLPAATYPIRRS